MFVAIKANEYMLGRIAENMFLLTELCFDNNGGTLKII